MRRSGGHGYQITGHHEVMIPLLAAALIETEAEPASETEVNPEIPSDSVPLPERYPFWGYGDLALFIGASLPSLALAFLVMRAGSAFLRSTNAKTLAIQILAYVFLLGRAVRRRGLEISQTILVFSCLGPPRCPRYSLDRRRTFADHCLQILGVRVRRSVAALGGRIFDHQPRLAAHVDVSGRAAGPRCSKKLSFVDFYSRCSRALSAEWPGILLTGDSVRPAARRAKSLGVAAGGIGLGGGSRVSAGFVIAPDPPPPRSLCTRPTMRRDSVCTR